MATPVGIVIVGCLVLLSTFSWSLMISKLWVLRKMRKQSEHFLRMFRGQQNPLEMFEMGNRFPYAPPAHVYRMACSELTYFLSKAYEGQREQVSRFAPGPIISPRQMEGVYAVMDRAAGEAAVRMEDKTAILATAVSGAPFLGLLGTVWGVMDTFSAVARDRGAANLQSMAPGVSAALLTTVVGLLVAIPAMFGYNFIVNRIRVMTVRLDNFTAELQSVLTKRFLAETSSGSDKGVEKAPSPAAARDDKEEVKEAEALDPMASPERGREFEHDPVPTQPPGPKPVRFRRPAV